MNKGEKRSANVITPSADIVGSMKQIPGQHSQQQMVLAYSIFQETMDEIERETRAIEEDKMLDSN